MPPRTQCGRLRSRAATTTCTDSSSRNCQSLLLLASGTSDTRGGAVLRPEIYHLFSCSKCVLVRLLFAHVYGRYFLISGGRHASSGERIGRIHVWRLVQWGSSCRLDQDEDNARRYERASTNRDEQYEWRVSEAGYRVEDVGNEQRRCWQSVQGGVIGSGSSCGSVEKRRRHHARRRCAV